MTQGCEQLLSLGQPSSFETIFKRFPQSGWGRPIESTRMQRGQEIWLWDLPCRGLTSVHGSKGAGGQPWEERDAWVLSGPRALRRGARRQRWRRKRETSNAQDKSWQVWRLAYQFKCIYLVLVLRLSCFQVVRFLLFIYSSDKCGDCFKAGLRGALRDPGCVVRARVAVSCMYLWVRIYRYIHNHIYIYIYIHTNT